MVPSSYACYTPAVIENPEGDLLNDWEFYWEIAERLRCENSTSWWRDTEWKSPTDDDILELIYAHSLVPFDEIRKKMDRLLNT